MLLRKRLPLLGIETPLALQLRHEVLFGGMLVGVALLYVLAEFFDLSSKAVYFSRELFPILLLIGQR